MDWLLTPSRKFHGVARRRPPANDYRNAAAPEDAQHDAAPAVIGVRRLDHADSVAISSRDFDRAWHAGQLDLDFAFVVDAAAPLIQLRPDPGGIVIIIVIVVVSIFSIFLASILRIGLAASI